jgi:hypothetical protein
VKKVYLGGPMRGYENFNYQAFEDATIALRAMGYEVYSPHEMDLELGFVDADWHYEGDRRVWDRVETTPEFTIHVAMRVDLRVITQMDAVVFLPGWQKSSGSKMEDTVREFCGISRWLITPLPTGEWALETNLEVAA